MYPQMKILNVTIPKILAMPQHKIVLKKFYSKINNVCPKAIILPHTQNKLIRSWLKKKIKRYKMNYRKMMKLVCLALN